MPKLGLLGSVRGVRSNAHPYRKQNRSNSDIACQIESELIQFIRSTARNQCRQFAIFKV